MYDFTALNDVIGTPEMISLGKQYESMPIRTKKGRDT
jgi:hypothetical protein